MNQPRYFTNVIQNSDGTINYIGLNKEKTCRAYTALLQSKYPNAEVKPTEVFGMVPCWHCGEPILFVDRHAAEGVCQVNDKLCCCSFCEDEKRKHYS